MNYSTSICSLESWKCGKEEEKLQICKYLENENSFLNEIKNIFHSVWRAIICWKKKIKNSGHKLQRERWGSRKTNIEGGDCLKRGGGAWQEREGGVFEGGLRPQCTQWYASSLAIKSSSGRQLKAFDRSVSM